MKPIKPNSTIDVQLRLNALMAAYMELVFDITHLPSGAAGELVRVISCTHHLLNVVLAMAAAEGISGEVVTKALDIGEESATALIKQSLKNVTEGSAQ